jgi:capsular exopolysaccharide synthesis family protein
LPQHDQAESLNSKTILALLRRRWRVMVPFVLIPIAALLFSLAQEEKYQASASVVFRDIENESLVSATPEREAATNVELLSLGDIQRRVQARLGPGESGAESVSASQQGESNLLTIEATDPSPRRAARTANAYALEYITFRARAAKRGLREQQTFVRRELNGLPIVDRQGPSGQDLQRQLRRLEFLESQEDGGVRLVSAATPPASPSSPKPVRNALVGGVVALFLAILAAVLFERLDPRLTTPKQVENALDRPIVGFIRSSRALARAPAAGRSPPPNADDFFALRAQLRYLNTARNLRSILITSGASGDGKTTIAWNLARAAAGRDTRVLFIEGDLRNPSLATALGAEPDKGLTDVLDGTATLNDAIEEVAVESGENGRVPSRIVGVVFAGVAPSMRPDPLDWERLGMAIQHAERDFDLIVIDTAPILIVPDAIPLLSDVGGVIVIGRLGSTPRAALARLKEQLETIDAPTVGVVVNSVDKDTTYGYGYAYGYRGRS